MDAKSGYFFYPVTLAQFSGVTVNTLFKMATSVPASLKVEQDGHLARFTTHALLPIWSTKV